MGSTGGGVPIRRTHGRSHARVWDSVQPLASDTECKRVDQAESASEEPYERQVVQESAAARSETFSVSPGGYAGAVKPTTAVVFATGGRVVVVAPQPALTLVLPYAGAGRA